MTALKSTFQGDSRRETSETILAAAPTQQAIGVPNRSHDGKVHRQDMVNSTL